MIRPVSLTSLPVELVCHILSFLDSTDLLECASTAKHLRKIVLSSSRLQYTIELANHRMVSILPPSSNVSYISRRKLLQDRENAWKNLRWNGRYNLKLPPTGSVYEFVGGLYGNGKEDDQRITASISFLELPSSDTIHGGDGVPDLKMWTHPMSDITIIDFTMDPSQDLLVLIALARVESAYVYELHLRSLSTNEPHPKAPLPILPCLKKQVNAQQATEHIAAVRVQVSGALVALLVKEVHDSVGAHLQIWDWIKNPDHSCRMARISGIDDFTFLSQSAFLLVRPTGNFEVYTFQNPIPKDCIPTCQASYEFPPLADGYMYWYITMSSNPAPGSIPRFPFSSPFSSSSPFSNGSGRTGTETGIGTQTYYPAPDERIHACCLYIFNPSNDDTEHRVHCFVFFVNLHSLLHPPEEWLRCRRSHRKKRRQAFDPPWSIQRPDAGLLSSSSSSSIPPPQEQTMPLPRVGSYPAPQVSIPGSTSTASSSTSSGSSPSSGLESSSSSHEPSLPFPPTQTTSRSIIGSYPAPRVSLASISDGSVSLSTSTSTSWSTPTPTPTPAPHQSAHVPWEMWGPVSTRWFEECLSTDWQHSIYGLRTVESVSPETLARGTGSTRYGITMGRRFVGGEKGKEKEPREEGGEGERGEGEGQSAGGEMVGLTEDGELVIVTGDAGASAASASTINDQTTATVTPPSINGHSSPSPATPAPTTPDNNVDPPIPRRHLRLRDYNPYAVSQRLQEEQALEAALPPSPTDNKGKQSFIERHRAQVYYHERLGVPWHGARVVAEPSLTLVKGVFRTDIMSYLPYVEVVSEEAFEVTDVMMDECRLLLLKRGENGKLRRVDVLTM